MKLHRPLASRRWDTCRVAGKTEAFGGISAAADLRRIVEMARVLLTRQNPPQVESWETEGKERYWNIHEEHGD